MNKIEKIDKKILILGAGTMGLQIALQCSAHGFNVSVYDVFDKVLEKAEKQISRLAEKLFFKQLYRSTFLLSVKHNSHGSSFLRQSYLGHNNLKSCSVHTTGIFFFQASSTINGESWE